MLGSIVFRSSGLQLVASEAAGTDLSSRPPPRSTIVCDAQPKFRNYESIPKLKPFSGNRIDRWLKDPPLLQKTKNELSEYCTTLEGDECSSCWSAYFELKDLEKEWSKEDLEKFLWQCGGIKTLIDYLHGITAMEKKMKEKETHQKKVAEPESRPKNKPFHIPDGLPPTAEELEELEEAEKARMPDSPFTRLLRSKGKLPAWYTPRPDHETD
ncbi:CCG-binding protein 1-like [Zingiber officinale]|uniref:CCG-binding protein 1 n=1 Tax=Zingiber officinale TaxID=94328 RepID=A0A8J5F619_ZINOF|nr:CCG-binding protein 1-like [Zingiber officinale]KAG6480545.1 hypothetical protein ZIOFF_057129 [Zingiber officinale]